MVRIVLLLLLPCLPALSGGGLRAVQAEDEKKAEPTALTVFRGHARRLVGEWKALQKKTTELRARIEAARVRARTAERAGGTWRGDWEKGGGDRMALHQILFRQALAWGPPLLALFATHETEALTAQTLGQVGVVVTDRVRAWLEVGEPEILRGVIETMPGTLPRALALPAPAHARRRLLATVADRSAATPGRSDLETLAAVLTWAAPFAEGRSAQAQAEQVSADLLLVFTERAENGLSKNDGRYHRARGLRDSGFGARFRDGSDQVRHFAWAFRMFVLSRDGDATERLLRAKEEQDARTRGEPLNEKDLALNRSARALVAELRDAEPGQQPPAPAAWGGLVQGRLGR